MNQAAGNIKRIALFAVGDSAWQGGIQYISNIIHALDSFSGQSDLEVHLFKRETQQFFSLNNVKNLKLTIHSIEDELPPYSMVNRLKWFIQRKVQGRIVPRFETYFIEQKFDFVFPATLSSCGGKLNVGSWIADFQYHHFPEGHGTVVRSEAEKTIGFIAASMPKVILSSRFCEKDCLELFPNTRGKTHVMPFTVYINENNIQNNFEAVRNKYGLEGPYMMVSNLFGATKNHKTLFEALGTLRKQGLRIKLVCTGNFVNYTQIEFTNDILQMITTFGIRDQLHILGLIPREDQITLYRMAMALVQPSMHEGWSTCVEEAKALGKVLVLSDIAVHVEQYPGNRFFFRTTDVSDLSEKLRIVYEEQAGKVFPEEEKERIALQKYRLSVRAFAGNFLEIAAL